MHITSLYLENIKCFEKLTYKFQGDGGASLVIAGDNGDGKSTILRSIAISLCDQWSAAGLLRELSGEFIRDRCDEGVIKLGLISGKKRKKRFEIVTRIRWDSKETYEYPYREINQIKTKTREPEEIEDSNFDWKAIFATAYGSGLRTVGTQDFQHYFTGDSIYSLFRDDVTLQNPELAIRRISTGVVEKPTAIDSQEEIEAFQKNLLDWLGEILILDNKSLEVHGNGIFVCTKGSKTKVPLVATGDGYKALTALILDMLSWWFLYAFYGAKTGSRNKAKITLDSLKMMKGVVIIDEIEQHLHPKWQSKILPSLEKNFPQVQFIVATHSPLVVSSSEDDVLVIEDGRARKEKLYGWLPEDVYIQMGREDERPPEIAEKISELELLYREKISGTISKQDEKRFNSIYEQLKVELPSHDPVLQTIKFNVMRRSIQDD